MMGEVSDVEIGRGMIAKVTPRCEACGIVPSDILISRRPCCSRLALR